MNSYSPIKRVLRYARFNSLLKSVSVIALSIEFHVGKTDKDVHEYIILSILYFKIRAQYISVILPIAMSL